jgi:xanthine dehydrogenase accessory factor
MWDWIGKSQELKALGVHFVILTVVKVTGSVPREVGAKMIVLEDGSFFGTVGGGGLEKNALEEALRFLRDGGEPLLRMALTPEHGHACGGTVEVLFEVMNSADNVFVFGVGHVGQALCRVLDETPFVVHAVDERAEWIDSPRLPSSIQRHAQVWSDFAKKACWRADSTYVVILTWSHELDFSILQHVLQMPCKYIGVIGSKRKWLAFREKLLAQGISESALARVCCPVGLALGGKSPQEVAISIAAELLQVKTRSPS